MTDVKSTGVALRAIRPGRRAANRLYSGQLAIAVTQAASKGSMKLCRIQAVRTTISAP